jgi:hypothetical protein
VIVLRRHGSRNTYFIASILRQFGLLIT